MARSPASGAAGPPGLAAGTSSADRSSAAEVAELRAQLREAQETIEAIRNGGIDSLVIGPSGQEQLYTLATADRPYRLIVQAMNEGAASVSPRGVILDANPRLCEMTGRSPSELVGSAALDLSTTAARAAFARLIEVTAGASARGEAELTGPDGTPVPVLLAVSGFDLDGMVVRCLVLTDLTAQRTAEAQVGGAHQALREQSALLEQAQASAGLGWWIAEMRPVVRLTASPQTFRIAGVAPGGFGGTTEAFQSILHPDDAQRVVEAAERSWEHDIPFRLEHRIIRPDGTVRWVQQSAVLARNGAGGPARMLGICQDITDRKRVEDEVRAAAAYNRSLIEASLEPIMAIDADGRVTDVNGAAEQVSGYRRSELVGSEFSGYFTDPDRARAGYEQVLREGSVRDYLLEVRHRDGHTTPLLCSASIYRDPSGRMRGILAAGHDVTESNRTQAALRQSESRLHAVVDHAMIGIGEITPDGAFVRVNNYLCQLTGYTADEFRSMRIQDVVHPDDRDADLAGLRRLLSGEIESYTVEKRYLRKDGGFVWAEVSRVLVRDESGRPLSVGTIRDITAQRHAEAEVRDLNADLGARVEERTADLERANKNLEAFTYSVSHDLRSPLRALSGFSEALLEEYGDRLDETGRGYAGRIEAASARMAALIDDLLLLSRVSRADMNVRPVDLSAEVADVVEELRLRDPGREVRSAIEDGVWVRADHTLVRSVVQNLIENAWKFTAQRDDATIEFGTTASDGDGISCYVRDNGAGFDPEYIGKLFQPFQRLHSAADFPGTGVGLASVQRIIERHGGRVWAEGAVDQGATFYFTVERASPPAGDPSRAVQ